MFCFDFLVYGGLVRAHIHANWALCILTLGYSGSVLAFFVYAILRILDANVRVVYVKSDRHHCYRFVRGTERYTTTQVCQMCAVELSNASNIAGSLL